MFKNRFLLVLGAVVVLLVTMAISRPFASAPTSEELNGPLGQVIVPVTGADEISDYHQRHPELRGGLATSANPALQTSPRDECIDVSISELAACREASQSASQ